MVFFVRRKIRAAIKDSDIAALDKLLTAETLEMDMGSGWTPLYYAARYGCEEAVNCLLKKGARQDARGGEGWTPLHTAASHGGLGIVVSLLKAGADPNKRNDDGATPLSLATMNHHADIAEVLKPYMKKASELFDLPAPPAPVVTSPANANEPTAKADKPVAEAGAPPAGWTLLSPTDIARVAAADEIGYKVTDIFNFGARERIRIICNLETKADSIETRPFGDLQDKAQLQEAFRALKAAGGSGEETCLDPLGKPVYPKLEPKTGL